MKMLKFSKELEFPLEAVTEKFDFMGQSGGGKTYDAMKLAELMLEAGAQIISIDFPGVWKGLRSSADGKSPGFKVLLVGGEGADLPINAGAGAMLADMVVDTGLSVIFDVSEMLGDEALTFLIAFFTRFFDRKKRSRDPVHVFLEECQEIIPEQIESKLQAKLRAICIRWMKIGRNYGIGWSAITQEPQAASKRAINQAGTIVAVRTMGGHERKALEAWARSKTRSKEQLALMDILPELEKGQALVWSPGWLKHAGVVNVLPKVTFDSSKTPEVGKKRATAKVNTEIDVAQLGKDIEALVKAADDSNPKLLQKKIAELEKQLAAKKLTTAREYPVTPEAAPKAKVKIIQEPVILSKDARELASVVRAAEAISTRLTDALMKFAGQLQPLTQMPSKLVALTASIDRACVVEKPTKRVEEVAPEVRKYTHAKDIAADFGAPFAKLMPVEPYRGTKGPGATIKIKPIRITDPSGPIELGQGARVVLRAIGQHGEAGVTREQLSVLTGYKRSSRDTYLQKLGAAGMIDSEGENIRANSRGFETLGADFTPLPIGEELREHWLRTLPAGERRVLEAVVYCYPKPVDRDALSEATGYKRSSRDTYLQKLGARKLVTADAAGIRASDLLFGAA